MQFTAQQLAVLAAALVPSVAGHGFVTGVKSGGVWYPGFDIQLYYQHPHAPVYGWDTTATDSGFVSPDAFATPDIICHRGGAPAALHIPVVAGSTITVYWTQSWPDGHQGPVIDYLAPCAGNDCSTVTKTDLKFAKIDEAGLISPNFYAENQLYKNNESWPVTIPASLKPGAYVLRHEIIALHGARSPNGAQSYPQCLNLMVSGSGSAAINGVSATTFYKATDPGILIDIYNNAANTYVIPGPPVQTFGGSGGGSGPAPTTTTLVTSVKPTTTSAVTTTPRPVTTTTTTTTSKPATTSAAGGSAALYGQCGGQGWNGPTTCASGTCKVSNQYFSQCLP